MLGICRHYGDIAKMNRRAAAKVEQDGVGKHPNGLADAIARLRAIDPEIGPTKLANAIGGNKQTIDRYIKWERKLPRQVAAKLAPVVKSTVAELLMVDSDLPSFERVPLVSWVSAGKLADVDPVTNVDIENHVIAVDLPKGSWIALRVRGDSMDRLAPDGSLVFVNRADTSLKEEQFYVFSLGTGAATFKRYRGKGGAVRLQPYSMNPDHETIVAPDDLRVVGRVRRVVTDLR